MAANYFRNISIKDKLILIQFIVALLSIITCTIIFFFSAINIFKDSQRSSIESLAKVVAANSKTPLMFNMPDATTDMLNDLRLEPNITHAIITDANGRVFSSYVKPGQREYGFRLPGLLPVQGSSVSDGNFLNFFYPITDDIEESVDQRLGYICFRMDNLALRKVYSRYMNTAFLSLAAALLTAILVSFYLQRSISQPLKKLLLFVKRVSNSKDYSLRVNDGSKDEIGILSTEFDEMLGQINERDHRLQEARDQLEDRVVERTVLLEETNEELIERTQELERSNKELEQFAYVASHDLQEPLRSIGGFTQLMGKRYKNKLDDEADEYIAFITDGVNRMQRLIRDLLLFSRLGRMGGTLGMTDMTDVIKRTKMNLRFAIEESSATVQFEEMPEMVAEEVQIGHLFQNLLSNAIKFKSDRPLHITVACEEKEKFYQFSVSDNGIGMEEEYLERIFLIFQRLHTKDEYQGSGIGLAICKKIAELHGGNIWVESKINQGSTFYFTISKKLKAGSSLIAKSLDAA